MAQRSTKEIAQAVIEDWVEKYAPTEIRALRPLLYLIQAALDAERAPPAVIVDGDEVFDLSTGKGLCFRYLRYPNPDPTQCVPEESPLGQLITGIDKALLYVWADGQAGVMSRWPSEEDFMQVPTETDAHFRRGRAGAYRELKACILGEAEQGEKE